MYRLRDYLPKKTTNYAKWFFGESIDRLKMSTEGKYVCGRPILNPFSPKVTLLNYTDNVFKLQDLRNTYTPSEEELKRRKEVGRRKQAEAGKKSASMRKSKSLKKILDAIDDLIFAGEEPNQTSVAKYAGLSRRTVNRHWHSAEVQKLLE